MTRGLAAAVAALSILGFGYAAEVRTVRSSDGRAWDVLVHRDGVVLFKKGEFFSGISFPGVAVSLFRRWRRGPWRWAVTVRQSPFHGYRDLVHETFSDRAEALARAQTLAQQIEAGTRPWPPEWET